MVQLNGVATIELDAVFGSGDRLLLDVAYDGSVAVVADKKQNSVAVLHCYRREISAITAATRFQNCDHLPTPRVTAIHIFPVASISPSFPEFLCVAIGYTTGHLEVYGVEKVPSSASAALSCTPLLRQRVHDSAVLRIKTRATPSVPVVGSEGHGEELYLLFGGSTVVIVEADGLLTSLRAQYAIATRGRGRDGREELSPTHVQCRKFQVAGQGQTADVVTHREYGGSESGEGSLILAVGKDPFLAVFCSTKDNSSVVQLASDVASKLKSSIFSYAKSWWNGDEDDRPQSESKPPPAITAGSRLHSINALQDTARRALTVVLDGTSRLAAMSDSFGRVILLDMGSVPPVVVRMWKGYREAQLSFFRSPLKSKGGLEKMQRYQLFLAIYAPRRGLLEVWEMRCGNRQAIMSVGPGCSLVNVACPLGKRLAVHTPARCFLVRGSSLEIEEVTVDVSQCGVDEASKLKFQELVGVLDRLREHTGTQAEGQEEDREEFDGDMWRSSVLEHLDAINDHHFLSLALEQIVDLAASLHPSPLIPLAFLRTCTTQAVSRMTDVDMEQAKAQGQSRRSSLRHALHQDLPRLRRLDNIVAASQVLEKLSNLPGLLPAADKEVRVVDIDADFPKDSAAAVAQSLALPELQEEDVDEAEGEDGRQTATFDANRFFGAFDNHTGMLHATKKQQAAVGRQLFHWLLCGQGQASGSDDDQEDVEVGLAGLFWEVLHCLQLPLPELLAAFCSWFLSLPPAALARIPLWESAQDGDCASLGVFLFTLRDVYETQVTAALEQEVDPFLALLQVCEESVRLEHVLVLSHFVIEQLRQMAEEAKGQEVQCLRSHLQDWARMRKRLTAVLTSRNWLYGGVKEVDEEADLLPLSLSKFQSSWSIFWLTAHYQQQRRLAGEEDWQEIPSYLESLFPDQLDAPATSSILAAHRALQQLTGESSSDVLRGALDDAALVMDPQVQRAVLLEVWEAGFVPRLSALLSLQEKLRKAPNERLLRRTVGFGMTKTIALLDGGNRLLEALLWTFDAETAVALVDGDGRLALGGSEDVWPALEDELMEKLEVRVRGDGGRCNVRLVQDTVALLQVLRVIVALRIDNVQPLRLFRTNAGFFSSFAHVQEGEEEDDPSVRAARILLVQEALKLDKKAAAKLSAVLGLSQQFQAAYATPEQEARVSRVPEGGLCGGDDADGDLAEQAEGGCDGPADSDDDFEDASDHLDGTASDDEAEAASTPAADEWAEWDDGAEELEGGAEIDEEDE